MLTEETAREPREGSEVGSVPGEEQLLDSCPLEHARAPIKLDMLPIVPVAPCFQLAPDVAVSYSCYLSRNYKGYIIANVTDIPVLDFDYSSAWKTKFSAAEFENYLFTNIERYTSNYRLYRTAGGYRAILTNEFIPVSKFDLYKYESMGGDALYNMCCDRDGFYRVRLTPKPCRLGISDLADVFDTGWLDNFEHAPEDQKEAYHDWLSQYATAGKELAVCRLVKYKNTDPIPPRISRFLEMHDSTTRAHLALHLA